MSSELPSPFETAALLPPQGEGEKKSADHAHGSNEPWTIGTNVSSGCIRMRNEDVIDLYGRVNVGARVVVI